MTSTKAPPIISPANNSQTPSPARLTIDWDAYASYLDDLACEDDQKRELIETLWSIVVACVDLKIGLNTLDTELVSKSLGQIVDSKLSDETAVLSSSQNHPSDETIERDQLFLQPKSRDQEESVMLERKEAHRP